MSPAQTIILLIASWLSVALTMLWGILRIARRHRYSPPQISPKKPMTRPLRVATAA